METVEISISSIEFDLAVKTGLSEGGDIRILIKDKATREGSACACITWTAKLPSGEKRLVQAVTTVTNLINALGALKGWREGGHIH